MAGGSLRFGDEGLLPSRAYASGWAQCTQQRWARYLTAYRERVEDVYQELVDEHPASFVLRSPVEVLAVVSLVREWVFVRPAAEDTITLIELWEDPLLSRRDMATRADHERRVREIAAVNEDFTLFEVRTLSQEHDLDYPPTARVEQAHLWGREKADEHAHNALTMPGLENALAALTGRSVDKAALQTLRGRLTEIGALKGPTRGNRFEVWLGDLLAAHGCQVERGKNKDGEQIDFFVHRPFRAVIECRWQKNRLQPRALSDLTAKLRRRPSIVAGIYVAMSGFADATDRYALNEPNRTVLLWDGADVQRLLTGDIHAWDLFEEHVSDRVRRYKNPD